MDHLHDDTDRDEGLAYVGRFGGEELTDEERATVQAAFAALVRAGRPLFGPVPEEGEGALIDPADPGLNTRVAAILDHDAGPRLLRRNDGGDTERDDAGAGLVMRDAPDRATSQRDRAVVEVALNVQEGEA